MEILKSPYFITLVSASLVYYLTLNNSTSNNKKEVKQLAINYFFITSIVVFSLLTYYKSSVGSEVEKTLKIPFND